MVSSELKDEILKNLDRLPPAMQHRVLEFARALVLSEPQGTPAEELLACVGILSEEDADEIAKAIEEGCEQVDPSEW